MALAYVAAALLSVQLPTNGAAAEDGPSVWVPSPTCKTKMKRLPLDFHVVQLWSLQSPVCGEVRGVNQWIVLSLPL